MDFFKGEGKQLPRAIIQLRIRAAAGWSIPVGCPDRIFNYCFAYVCHSSILVVLRRNHDASSCGSAEDTYWILAIDRCFIG